jgi:hypothetical protein
MLYWIRNLALRAAIHFEKSRGTISEETEEVLMNYIESQ